MKLEVLSLTALHVSHQNCADGSDLMVHHFFSKPTLAFIANILYSRQKPVPGLV